MGLKNWNGSSTSVQRPVPEKGRVQRSYFWFKDLDPPKMSKIVFLVRGNQYEICSEVFLVFHGS